MRRFSFRGVATAAASALTVGVMAGTMATATFVSSAEAQQGVGWVSGRGATMPNGAVAGGKEPGRTLFICRAGHARGMHPGKVVAGKCNIGYGGREIVSTKFQVMVNRGARIAWVAPQGGRVPPNAFVAGKEPGRTLFVCRAPHRDGIHPGKVVAGKCNFGYGGREIVSTKYQVMVVAKRPGAPPAASLPKGMGWALARGPKLPAGAVGGGHERGRPVFICRAPSRGGLLPGKLIGRRCIISTGGREVSAPKYQILVRAGQGVRWMPAPAVKDLRTAFPGGSGPRVMQHACSGRHGDGRHPGKLVNGVCYIAHGAKEVPLRQYNVLVNRGGAKVGWIAARGGQMPHGAVSGGSAQGKRLYVCRGPLAGGLMIGKVWNKTCHIGYRGRAHRVAKYQVMVAK